MRHAAAADRAGFMAHEQALTEIVLTRASSAAHVRTFNQREEARTGADWLWWWRGGGEWFGVLVQAKRNKPVRSKPSYDFGYRSGSGSRQVDLLLHAARHFGVPAMYVLYNHPPIPRAVAVSSPCCVHAYEGWRTRLRVAVVPALVAQTLVGAEERAVQYARPLECLVCRGRMPRLIPSVWTSISDDQLIEYLTGSAASLPRLVSLSILAQVADQRLGQFRQSEFPLQTGLDERDNVFTDLPSDGGHFSEPYFDHVLRGLRSKPPWYIAAALDGAPWEEVAQDLEGIQGVVIFDDDRSP